MEINNDENKDSSIDGDTYPKNFFNNDGQNNTDNSIDYKELVRALFRKRKWAFIAGSLTFFAILGYSINERYTNPIYSGTFSLLIKDPINPGTRSENTLASETSTFYQNLAQNSRRYDVESLITLFTSPEFLSPLAKNYNLNPKFLSSKINILVPRNSAYYRGRRASVLNVTMIYKNRETGKKLLDDLADTFLTESLRQRQRTLNDGLEFLKKQLPKVQEKENFLQTKLVSFRKKHKLINPIVEGNALRQEQRETETIIAELMTMGNRLKKVREEVLNGSLTARGFNDQLGDGLSISDFDQSLLTELISLENELAKAKSKFTKNSSMVKGLELRLSQIQPAILKNQIEAVDIAINLNANKLNDIIQNKKRIEEKFLQQPKLIKEFERINTKLNVANRDLINLNSTITSFELELAQNNIPWRIISAPNFSKFPIKPSIKRNATYGFIVSIIVGIIAALVRDRTDHVFHSTEDAQETLKIPTLGEIPYIKNFSDLRTNDKDIIEFLTEKKINNEQNKERYTRFYYTEALRNLFTSIRFLNTGFPIRTLAISSSIPMEGKSLLNILLAKTLSDMGERVLLIDADLRKPKLHNRLGLNNILGLSNYLTDNQTSFIQIAKPLKEFKNIDVITSGTIPPDPTRLLNSPRISELLTEVKKTNKYDIVLFDTPPILGLADTILLSKNLDGLILLVGLGVVDRSLPKESTKRLRSNRVNLLGLVTNSVKSNYAIEYSGYMKYSGYNSKYIYNNYLTYSNYIDNKDGNKLPQKTKPDKKQDSSEKINNALLTFKKIKNEIFKWLDS